ncbi:WLM domain-containing protein [Polychytrium aggregatum]|uniref:WLM domain-containing protein n=1 Tax=Polychytrium aggregatum TaxID=110093 RepID=UPI0022FE5316|nr:WLM domain-containing protein [Polychytrium aggregatum]KAI9202480.1 WLM domain-containing protein [Polychytrium aggregatum]
MAKKAAFREAQQQKALLNQRIRPLVSDRLTQQDLQQRQYTFHAIETLPHYRDAHVARSLLERLKNDRGIQTIMKAHKWSVGLLKELDPAVATILGFNRNAGMEIALRLRTDDREGFRHYDSIRKVLLHELAHMVHGDHDEHFHALNRQLNKECDAVHREAHLLDGSRLPSSVSAQQAAAADSQDELSVPYFSGGAFVLGGSIPGGNPGSDGETSAAAETSQQRRELLLRAVMNRLSAEEQEIMESCSSTESKPSA